MGNKNKINKYFSRPSRQNEYPPGQAVRQPDIILAGTGRASHILFTLFQAFILFRIFFLHLRRFYLLILLLNNSYNTREIHNFWASRVHNPSPLEQVKHPPEAD